MPNRNQEPSSLDVLLSRARVQLSGTVSGRANLMLADREACHARKYHRVDSQESQTLMIQLT